MIFNILKQNKYYIEPYKVLKKKKNFMNLKYYDKLSLLYILTFIIKF